MQIKVGLPRAGIGYKIDIGHGLLAHGGEHLRKTLSADARRVLIVSNAQVFGLYGNELSKSLVQAKFAVSHWLMGDGERYKSWRSLEAAIAAFGSAGLERTDAVVALGGGVVGDLAGLASSLYLRGISLVQMPTTLLAQIDSSVGGKTGINTNTGKNLVGTFHHPAGVFIDPATLATLPRRELTAGWCEAIKLGAVADRRLFLRTKALLENGGWEPAELENVIAGQCAAKARIVRGDEREDPARTDPGSRRTLNFGHTVGHALETATKYRRFRHGEAVGVGMLVAGEIGKKLGILAANELELLRLAIKLAGRLPPTRDLDPAVILDLTKRDKKSIAGKLKWIMLERVGKARIVDGGEIPRTVIRESLKKVLGGKD